MQDTIIILFQNMKTGLQDELEIPLGITASDLFAALNEIYGLGENDVASPNNYLKSENPISFLKGSKKLSEYGLRDGTIIIYS